MYKWRKIRDNKEKNKVTRGHCGQGPAWHAATTIIRIALKCNDARSMEDGGGLGGSGWERRGQGAKKEEDEKNWKGPTAMKRCVFVGVLGKLQH